MPQQSQPIDLVTGGTGFIGSHVVQQLRARGRRVRILDPCAPSDDIDGVEFIQGSITDESILRKSMAGASRVFHLAARAELWLPDREEFLRVNHAGTRNVLRAAAELGVETVIHCSTEAVLAGAAGTGGMVDEDARPALSAMPGPYPRAKLLAEREAFAAAEGGQRVVVVAPTVPIGPGDRHLTPPARMLLGFLNDEYPAYLETVLNLVDVRDVAAGHIQAAEYGRSGRRYLLAGVNLPLSTLLAQLETLSGLPMTRRRIPYPVAHAAAWVGEWLADHLTHRPPTAPLTGVRLARAAARFDNHRARAELGVHFRPVEETLRAAITDYQARGLLRRAPAGGAEGA